jgi:DNA-binding Lrp family transcriptional regulator
MSKLEASGIIRGYTLRLDEDYNRNLVSAQVMIEINPKMAKQVNTRLLHISQVRSLYSVNGQYELMAMIKAENTEQLDQVLDQIGAIEGINKTLSSIVLSTKFER